MILSETAKETAPYFPFEAINAVGKFGDAIKIYVQFVPIFFLHGILWHKGFHSRIFFRVIRVIRA